MHALRRISHSSAPFNVLATHVNLSASSTTVILTPDAGATAVTVTGDLAGCAGQLMLVSPYGTFGAGKVALAGLPAVATPSLSNPDGYTCQWMQARTDSDYLGSGNGMTWMSIAGPVAHSASVVLPVLDTSIGITEIPNPAVITYTGGILEIPVLAGTNYRQFLLYDVLASRSVAVVITTTPRSASLRGCSPGSQDAACTCCLLRSEWT